MSMLGGPCGEVAQEIWDTEVPGRRAASLGMWVGVRWLEIWWCEDGEGIGRQPWGGGVAKLLTSRLGRCGLEGG